MGFLLLYVRKGYAFNKDDIKTFWARCPGGVSELRENAMVGAALDAKFTLGNDSTLMELKSDQETIVLSGTGDASIEMAFLLQSICKEPLHVVDEGYSFDFVVRDYQTAQGLGSAICAALKKTE